MQIKDPANRITEQQIATLCQIAGLPAPELVDGGESGDSQIQYGLRFPQMTGVPPHVLRVDYTTHARGAAVDHTLAASNALKLAEGIPCRQDGRRIDDSIFGHPAALYRFAKLSTGQRLGLLKASFFKTAISDLGNMLAQLADHPVPHFGLRARENKFLPSRNSWREEWENYVYRLNIGAKRMGLDYGPLGEQVLREIQERLDSLDHVSNFSLVHGELRLDSLEYMVTGGEPELVNIRRFGRAMQGDHLVEVPFLLNFDPKLLGPILKAYGLDRVEEWLEPDALRRIEVYLLTLALTRPSYAAHQVLQVGQLNILEMLEYTRERIDRYLQPNFVKTTLETALEHVDFDFVTFGPRTPPHRGRTVLRQTLACLRGDKTLPAAQAPLLCLALGASGLTVDVDTEPTYEKVLFTLSQNLLNLFPGLGIGIAIQPITDRVAWRQNLMADVVSAVAKSPATAGSTALLLSWLGLSGIDRLEGTVSDSVLRGLEALVRAMVVHDATESPANDVLRLQHAVTGRAALVWLAEAELGLNGDTLGNLASRYDDRIQELIDLGVGTDVPSPTDQFPIEAFLPLLLDGTANQEQQLTRPLLVLALCTLHGRVKLPADIPTLLKLMGG